MIKLTELILWGVTSATKTATIVNKDITSFRQSEYFYSPIICDSARFEFSLREEKIKLQMVLWL